MKKSAILYARMYNRLSRKIAKIYDAIGNGEIEKERGFDYADALFTMCQYYIDKIYKCEDATCLLIKLEVKNGVCQYLLNGKIV